jgi:hypothetical protein
VVLRAFLERSAGLAFVPASALDKHVENLALVIDATPQIANKTARIA